MGLGESEMGGEEEANRAVCSKPQGSSTEPQFAAAIKALDGSSHSSRLGCWGLGLSTPQQANQACISASRATGDAAADSAAKPRRDADTGGATHASGGFADAGTNIFSEAS